MIYCKENLSRFVVYYKIVENSSNKNLQIEVNRKLNKINNEFSSKEIEIKLKNSEEKKNKLNFEIENLGLYLIKIFKFEKRK